MVTKRTEEELRLDREACNEAYRATHTPEDYVVDHYIATGSGLTAAAVAQAFAITPARARKLLGDSVALCSHAEGRTTYSRDYPSMEHGVVRVYVYEPTKDHLRRMLQKYLER
jgi:hypothetical protein